MASYKSRIPQFTAALAPRVDDLVEDVAEVIAMGARRRVAVDTGELLSKIHVRRSGMGEFMVVAGDRETFYGHLVENGTTHSPAQPFMVPAAEDARSVVPKMGRVALRNR